MVCPRPILLLPALLPLFLLTGCHPHPTSHRATSLASLQPAPQDLFVSPTTGDDHWSGHLPAPNRHHTDGPLRTIEHARNLLRQRKQQHAGHTLPTTVWLRDGRYQLDHPLTFGPDDATPTTYAAYPNEHPTLTAGRPLTHWTPTTVNGHPAWSTPIPEGWDIRELFVDNQRAPRPRLPKLTGDGSHSVFRMEHADNVPTDSHGTPHPVIFKGADAFTAKPGDFTARHNLQDVEAVVLHFWIEERMPVASYDPATRRVVSTRQSQMGLADDWTGQWARYYLDNVFEALSDPGQWYFDRPAHQLYYLPKPGQTSASTRIEAAGIDQLLLVHHANNLTFRGLTFENTGWHHPSEQPPRPGQSAAQRSAAPDSPKPPAGLTQSAHNLPAALEFTHAHNCRVEDCTIRHVGLYALSLNDGCTADRITGNTITDCGGGGVKIGGAGAHDLDKHPSSRPADSPLTGDDLVSDNTISHIGRVFHSAAAVLVTHAYAVTIAHNDLSDGYQMAVGVGWSWGYGPSVARDNHIEYNHIHTFGQGWLSDLGGVYTLGVQPGTTVRNNLIHDITAATYGGWGIYPDEGSSHLLIENNVVHDTSHQTFHQHYGQDNLVRNNVFAFGLRGLVEISRKEDHNSLTLDHNILLTTDHVPLFGPNIDSGRNFTSDHNLVFDLSSPTAPRATATKSWPQWQQTGHDQHSTVTNPLFTDPLARNFTLSPNSPALPLGFHPIDLSTVGPRNPSHRD